MAEHLYELAEQYQELSLLADNPDVPENAFMDTMDALEGDIQIKAEALLKVVHGWKRDIETIDAELGRMRLRKQAIQNRSDSLREYLRVNMEKSGIDKISYPLFDITLGQPKPVVEVFDENLVPDDYVNIKVERKPDKARIGRDLKKGTEIPGCRLGQSIRPLIIN